jgi:F-type H+-transporting ATPase subunit d
MAARRITKSAVDWAKLADKVPANQKDCFRAFKGRSDMFVARVNRYPAEAAAIDFSAYKSKLSNKALVDKFEKAYAAVSVPYPSDSGNTLAAIDASEQEQNEKTAEYIRGVMARLDDARSLLDNIGSVPPLEKMTAEMYWDYFPENAMDPVNRPTFYPHDKASQCGTPNEIPVDASNYVHKEV